MGISAATLSRFECDEMNGRRLDLGRIGRWLEAKKAAT
jgi:hypothetical protein